MEETEGVGTAMQALVALMARLRGAQGCPWDKEQSWRSLVPYTIEEAYEVAEAVETGQVSALRDELGDLLFHVVFYSRIAEEQGDFSLQEVIEWVVEKMTRRHPHVFASPEGDSLLATEVPGRWEEIKRQEKSRLRQQQGESGPASLFDDVHSRLPALLWAAKVQRKMGQIGFDWPDVHGVLRKVHE
ncbi:nucleoside triphosphate pyrophosphohydrolase, partial [Candidatus Magnetaquicoccus inordinatus]|uniref:nucleoside triphosphate pyrophosphohydrolase n=1 Tax=Candidatus Magnetaquicoccus inordinatus TaxID=2496818 RepID=UPI001D0F1BF9